MEGMVTYTLNVPMEKARLFRSLAKEIGCLFYFYGLS